MRGKWNEDVDLGDGVLQELRKKYDKRQKDIMTLADKEQSGENLVCKLPGCIESISDDVTFLSKGITVAVKKYKEKYSAANTPVTTLKDCNWDVVEYQTLLEDAQAIRSICEKCRKELAIGCNENQLKTCKALSSIFK